MLFMLLLPICGGKGLCAFAKDKNDKPAQEEYRRAAVVKAYRISMKELRYDEARRTVDKALDTYAEAAGDAQMYRYKMDAIGGLIGAENKKIYLQNKPDTVLFFRYIYDLYQTGLACDSVEQQSLRVRMAEGKHVKPKLRSGVGESLLPYRKNLFGAGKFHYKHKNYAEAWNYLRLYDKTKKHPVFIDSKGTSMLSDPDDRVEVGVLAVLSAYASGNPAGVLEYLDEGLKDEALRPQLLEIGAKAAAEVGDTVKMMNLLETGFDTYPDTEYFFATLVRYYNEKEQYDLALKSMQRMVALYPDHRDYWYMMGKEQMLMGNYDNALVAFQKCVEIKADDSEAYSVIGNIYLHEAHAAYAQLNASRVDAAYVEGKKLVNEKYRMAQEAFEQACKFNVDEKELWYDGLRECYFKLNKGKLLKALEKYK